MILELVMVHALDRCIAWYVDQRGGGGAFGGVPHVAHFRASCMKLADRCIFERSCGTF